MKIRLSAYAIAAYQSIRSLSPYLAKEFLQGFHMFSSVFQSFGLLMPALHTIRGNAPAPPPTPPVKTVWQQVYSSEYKAFYYWNQESLHVKHMKGSQVCA